MLQISGTYGSYNRNLFGAVTEEKGVQTEETEEEDLNQTKKDNDDDAPPPSCPPSSETPS